MNILFTGGAATWTGIILGNGKTRRNAISAGCTASADDHGIFVAGSILDRDFLERSLKGVAVVVHIAAWHGLHELHGLKNVFDFWELNVTGTFYVFECAVRAGSISGVRLQHQHRGAGQPLWAHQGPGGRDRPHVCQPASDGCDHAAATRLHPALEQNRLPEFYRMGGMVLAGGGAYCRCLASGG